MRIRKFLLLVLIICEVAEKNGVKQLLLLIFIAILGFIRQEIMFKRNLFVPDIIDLFFMTSLRYNWWIDNQRNLRIFVGFLVLVITVV